MATDPATVNSISSAMYHDRVWQTVVVAQVPKVTQNLNGIPKLVARRVVLFARCGKYRPVRCQRAETGWTVERTLARHRPTANDG